MADPYGNYLANLSPFAGPGLAPMGMTPEQAALFGLSKPPEAMDPGLSYLGGGIAAELGPKMGLEALQSMSDLGHGVDPRYNSAGLDVGPKAAQAAQAVMSLGGFGMPMAEARALGSFGGRGVPDLVENYRSYLGPRNELLGDLPASPAARMDRARQLGFNPDEVYYHGRHGPEFEGMAFRQPTQNYEPAIFLTKDPEVANSYANGASNITGIPVNNEVMPLVSRVQNPKEIDLGGKDYFDLRVDEILQKARAEGHDAVWLRNMEDVTESGSKLQDQLAVFHPSNLRSQFAAFNPMYSHTDNLLSTRFPSLGLPPYRGQDQR